jgi:hypothetical protein
LSEVNIQVRGLVKQLKYRERNNAWIYYSYLLLIESIDELRIVFESFSHDYCRYMTLTIYNTALAFLGFTLYNTKIILLL